MTAIPMNTIQIGNASFSVLRQPYQVNNADQLPPIQYYFIAICICIEPSQTYGPV